MEIKGHSQFSQGERCLIYKVLSKNRCLGHTHPSEWGNLNFYFMSTDVLDMGAENNREVAVEKGTCSQ
jgi:hypothetical protein